MFLSTYTLSILLDLSKSLIETYFNIRYTSRPLRPLNSKEVVVVIPAHNSEDVIAQTIAHVKGGNAYKVVVVANACTDNTVAVAKSFADVEIIETEIPGKIHAVLLGVLRARQLECTHFLLLDDDVVWPSGSLISVYDRADPITAIPVVPVKTKNWIVNCQVMEYQIMVASKRAQHYVGNVIMASGAAGVYRVDNFLDTIKHHDGEHIGDDYQYCAINHHLGNRLALSPEVVLTHPPTTIAAWWKQRAKRWEVSPIINIKWLFRIIKAGNKGPGIWISLVSMHRALVAIFDVLRLVSFPRVLFAAPKVLLVVASITYLSVLSSSLIYRLAYQRYATKVDAWSWITVFLYPIYGAMAWLSRLYAIPRGLRILFSRGPKKTLHELYKDKYLF